MLSSNGLINKLFFVVFFGLFVEPAKYKCKNKGNQQPAQAARPVQEQKNTVPNQTVQDSVKKIVEKYYNKK